MNFGKLIKGQNYNIAVKLVDKYNKPIILDGPVYFEFKTPEQCVTYNDENTYNPNNYTLNTNNSIELEPLLIQDGACYQDTNDSSTWIANITVPDNCIESHEGYEYYSVTFYCNYKKIDDNNNVIAKEIQKLFTVHEPQLSVLNENMPYIFYMDSHLTGNILLPQPYEIDEITIKFLDPQSSALIYEATLNNPTIYKQNSRYNIYTFMSGQPLSIIFNNIKYSDRLLLCYTYTLKTQERFSIEGTYGNLGSIENKNYSNNLKDQIKPIKQKYHLNNPVFIMSEKIIQMIMDVKFEIEKAGIFNYDKYLVWRDHDIYEALLLGLSRLNGTYPSSSSVTYNTLNSVPAAMQYGLRNAALFELYKAWFLAESFKKFDFQGMDISLSIDRTDALSTLMDKADEWLKDNISDTKKSMIGKKNLCFFSGTISYLTSFPSNSYCPYGINIF